MMQVTAFARSVAFLGLGLFLSLSPVRAAPAAAPIAFVEAVEGTKDLASLIRVKRGRSFLPVKGRFFSVVVDDEITLRDSKAAVVVRYLGNNAVHRVRRTRKGGAGFDYRVRAIKLAGLTEAVFNWLAEQIVGNPTARPPQEITASSRSVRGGCAAMIDGIEAPLQFRAGSVAPQRVVRGGQPVPVTWVGGEAPYRLEVSGAAMPKQPDTCFAQINGALLDRGPVVFSLRDGSNADPVSLAVEVTDARPDMPDLLAKAAISETARQLYYASWLSGLDNGAWTIEAHRVVLAQDCTLPEVSAWLESAGLIASCRARLIDRPR